MPARNPLTISNVYEAGTMARFHDLVVSRIDRDTPEAIAIAFELTPDHRKQFAFQPGQYLTLSADIDGEEIRRSYSICSTPDEGELRVGVKHVEGGRFSSFLHEKLKTGDTVRVMPPEGRFTPKAGDDHDYLLIAAGSGITPMLSIAETVLRNEPGSSITLVYGNKTTDTIMFRSELDDLKDLYLQRFSLIHVLSRETQDFELLNGRIDGAKISAMVDCGLIDPKKADAVFICGPGAMIDEVTETLTDKGIAPAKLRFERFTVDGSVPPPRPASKKAQEAAASGVSVEVVLDGTRKRFTVGEKHENVLDAAHDVGIELPYSCAGGMCCTCRCKVLEGSSEMAVNYSLQLWEIEAGFTLACQTRPTSDKLVLDFDAV